MLEGKQQLSYSIAILIFTYFRRFRCSANFRGSKISSFVLSSFPPKFSCIVIIRVFRMLAIRVDTRYYRGGISGQRKLQHQYRTYVCTLRYCNRYHVPRWKRGYLFDFLREKRKKKERMDISIARLVVIIRRLFIVVDTSSSIGVRKSEKKYWQAGISAASCCAVVAGSEGVNPEEDALRDALWKDEEGGGRRRHDGSLSRSFHPTSMKFVSGAHGACVSRLS